jgi:hypothetical protein
LANTSTNRSRSLSRFIEGVPNVRLMTGTFINSDCSNALGQSRFLDPAAFGTESSFMDKYAASTSKYGKVMIWRSGAEADIKNVLSRSCSYIQANRKEWAALLPQKHEKFHFVELSEGQMAVYHRIFEEIIKEIEKDKGIKLSDADTGDEQEAMRIELLLKPYLARIEMFLAACELDKLADELSDEDKISPKSHKVAEILEDHFASGDEGKVLIFTSFRNSAKSIYDNLPAKFKKYALHYVSEDKNKMIPLIKKSKDIKIVVGVEHSLNTGHNFQMFSRLIRIESVWNPGTLEQAESRINRPDPKNMSNQRAFINFDWILAQSTMDITKAARLMAKTVHAVKFDNSTKSRYSELPTLPLVSMTFENILQANKFDAKLGQYLEAYQSAKQLEREEFSEIKNEYKELYGDNPIKQLPLGKLIKGSKSIDVPYVPNMVLPYQEELGLQNMTDYAMDRGMFVDAMRTDDLKGVRVHTEYGDGVITSASGSSVRVTLDTGVKISCEKTTVFVIPKNSTVKNYRNQIKSLVLGKPVEDIKSSTPKPEKPSEPKVKQTQPKEKPESDVVENENTEATVSNIIPQPYIALLDNVLCLEFFLSSDTDDSISLPKGFIDEFGLLTVPKFRYMVISNKRQLAIALKQISTLNNRQVYQDELEDFAKYFSDGKNKLFNHQLAKEKDIRGFFLSLNKRPKKGEHAIYPMVDGKDENFFLIAPEQQPEIENIVTTVVVPGCKWYKQPSNTYVKPFVSPVGLKNFVKLLKSEGYSIENEKELISEFKLIKAKL